MSIRFVLGVALLSVTLSRVGRAQFRAGQTIHPDGATVATALARVDSATHSRLTRTIIGASIGGVLGASLGYGLALLGHRWYCEGTVQCATRPDRAIRESVRGGIVVGGVLGGAIAWSTGRGQEDRR
jgi:hypothetical protein